MRLQPILNEIEATLDAQLQLADPALAEAAPLFLQAFMPAVRQGLVRAAELAAAEISAQLGDRRVDVRLADGEPELVLATVDGDAAPPTDDDLEARLTLRLPTQLKAIIEDAAASSGESINGWVVDALRSRTRRVPGRHVKDTLRL